MVEPGEKTQQKQTLVGGRYCLEALLAKGGMSVLYRGTDTLTGHPVAVKSVRSYDFETQEVRDRFLLEIRAASRLRHPNIVRMLDSGEDDEGAPFLVMEMLEGRSLQDELDSVGKLSVKQAFELLVPLLGALAHAHEQGIIHRDIKPANVFLSRDADGQIVPKLLDFGISMVKGSTRLTQSGMVVGTVQYMSPEQAQGLEVGAATDVWAMGVVFYRCLAGEVPFKGERVAHVLLNIVNKPPPELISTSAEVGPRVASAIDRALRYDVSKRYLDIHSFARALCVSACAEGVKLPEEPEPIGLPDWQRWCAGELPEGPCATTGRERIEQALEDIFQGPGVLPAARRRVSRFWLRWPTFVLLALATIGVGLLTQWWVNRPEELNSKPKPFPQHAKVKTVSSDLASASNEKTPRVSALDATAESSGRSALSQRLSTQGPLQSQKTAGARDVQDSTTQDQTVISTSPQPGSQSRKQTRWARNRKRRVKKASPPPEVSLQPQQKPARALQDRETPLAPITEW